MIAHVPHEAACDGRLTSTAKSLLMYLSGHDIQTGKWYGKWCWEGVSDIALAMSDSYCHYSPKMIRDARFLLHRCGYIERRIGVFMKDVRGRGRVEVHHICYRVIVSIEDLGSLSVNIA